MTTQVGKLHKRTIVKDLSGNIISLRDEANGGWIIRDRQVVNEELWNEYVRKEKDKAEAAKAAANPKIRENYPESKNDEQETDKVSKLEAEITEMKELLKKALEK